MLDSCDCRQRHAEFFKPHTDKQLCKFRVCRQISAHAYLDSGFFSD